MVFPISDDNSDRRTVPVVNYVIIAINVLVFVVLQGMGTNVQFMYKFSVVPEEIMNGKDVMIDGGLINDPYGRVFQAPRRQPTQLSVYVTLLTSMFLHGSIMHLLGNMWFLWVFGDNVEDEAGHLLYLAFYLLTGVVASLSHVIMNMSGPDSLAPSLGASGAISGVMGAYLVLHPKRHVKVLVWRVMVVVPGYMAVGLWFLFQLVCSLGFLGGGEHGIRVAYAAHIGGFLAGAVLAGLYADIRDRYSA